ncbi:MULTISPECIES: hypothetical protein [Bacillus]|uniref:hypothetical protein n=1 Tax=Bacillus TaxID=1386 RepID=UPI0002BDD510|nr:MULTISPECIES: hypothetical protein [Bacillus]ANT57253.1 hypothetical protein VP59_10645 [Bacillus pumilus]EMI12271.1 hypothetical protein C883_3240 [Bacillus stratosphericus LAMA 585]ATP94574.1 hypothetical protein CSE15_11635 [Bacillus altitudinis]KDE30782.1 hypothetical protein BA79_10918 [Bacillus altitudinis 41KF2b]KSU69735.1 hypothetical protein AS035_13075 [Bacillus altitudinis]
MKKFRGKKRYFRNVWEEVNTCDLILDHDSWFYFWHTHLDFSGVGENSLKIRREHIKAHIALYNRLLKQLEAFKKPYQTWICIHEHDPGLDAVYVHTPNPNDNYFPHKMEKLEANCKLPHTFKDLVDLHQFDVSCYQSEGEEVFYIQSKEQGIRL